MSNSLENGFSAAHLTPSYYLTRRHEDLNIFLKASLMGAESKKLHLPEKIGPLWKLLRKKGAGWGTPVDWTNPERNVVLFLGTAFQMGVASAFSSFDRFLDESSAEFDRYSSFFVEREDSNPRNDDVDPTSDKLSRVYERISLDTTNVDFFTNFFLYYQELRNCIVHRAGIASRGSVTAYERIVDSNALSEWSKKTGHIGPIQLTKPEFDRSLRLQINDVLLASTTLVIIARDISGQICKRISVDGLTYLASRAVLRDIQQDPNAQWKKNKSFESAVAAFLGEYNRLGVVRAKDVQEVLKRIDYFNSGNRAFLSSKL